MTTEADQRHADDAVATATLLRDRRLREVVSARLALQRAEHAAAEAEDSLQAAREHQEHVRRERAA